MAFPLDEVLHASPAYRWTLNHTLAVDDPMELFQTQVATGGWPRRGERHDHGGAQDPGQDDPQQERGRQQDHLRHHLQRCRGNLPPREGLGALTRAHGALYRIPPERISDCVEYDPGLAIKFTIYRLVPSGSAGDADIFGASSTRRCSTCPSLTPREGDHRDQATRNPGPAAAVRAGAGLPLVSRAQSEAVPPMIPIVVPFAPGGSNDVIARVIGPALGKRLNVNVIIEKSQGAAGSIGSDAVAKAAPKDGSTLLLTSSTLVTSAATMPKTTPYDVLTAFTPVAVIGQGPMLVAVSATPDPHAG